MHISRALTGCALAAVLAMLPAVPAGDAHVAAQVPGTAAAPPGMILVRVVTTAGEPLAAVLVSLRVPPDTTILRSTVTDAGGRGTFVQVQPGRYVVRAERLGHAPTEVAMVVASGAAARADLVLPEAALGLPGLIVEAQRRRARFEESAGATVGELTQLELKLVPTIGEADVLRAIEVLPGVVSTSDFSSAFNVRGGGADQNLILLDGFPIYNPFHLGGLFSVFNADMVSRVELLSGGFPAQYGGRVSSVLSIESDAGERGTGVQAGLSLLATRVALGVDVPQPLIGGLGLHSGRARLSVRRSYFDQLLRPVFDFPYHLTDVQLYAEAWTPGGGRLAVTGYTGRDVLNLTGADSFPLRVRWNWGNDVLGVSWVTPLQGDRTLDVRVGVSRFGTGISFPDFGDTDFRSRVGQWLARADLTTPAGPFVVGLGLAADRVHYDNRAETGGTVFRATGEPGLLGGAYAQAAWRTGDLLVETGVRGDAWVPRGGSGSTVLQPRLAVKHFIGSGEQALKLAVGRYSQFAHSLRDEELPLGIDIWVLSGERAPHVVSDQVQAGIEGYIGASWFGAVEGYYRRFDGVATTNPADDPADPTDDLLAGTGLSYGADVYVRRERGSLRPMVAVSWLRAWREFDDAFAGTVPAPPLRYAPIFDRRIDVDLVVQALLPRALELGVRWSLGSGLPYTRPLGAYVYHDYSTLDRGWQVPGAGSDTARSAIVLGPRNAERYPAYHRLDVSLRKTYRRRWGTLTPHLDVLNVYNRRNVLFYFYEYDRTPPVRSGLSMFPFLPTAGLEVRF
jgi:hypothetical protein